jgi:hypothetical protein
VQPDLVGLEISKGELRRLTGFDPEDVFRPSIMADKDKRLGFFLWSFQALRMKSR